MTNPLRLGPSERIGVEDISGVARAGRKVELPAGVAELLDRRRAAIVKAVEATEEPLYGFNRGFGSNVRDAVLPERLKDLQRNLIASHAICVGEPAPADVVRATMLLRAQSLARGHSSVRSIVVRQLIDFLNAGLTPVVPRLGTVSASGDLAPLSHVAYALIGGGDVFDAAGERKPAAAAMTAAGLAPLDLEMKEGLALNNGCQYAAAWTALAAVDLRRGLDAAILATALAGQAMFGSDAPYRADLHALRPHQGAVKVAAAIARYFKDSPIRELHREFDVDGEVQDPYNLRCAAQILGACEDLVARAIDTVEIEANSVTDNPIDVSPLNRDPTTDDIVSGGHFHGMPIAVDAYGLIQAAAIIGRLTNMRCARYVDRARNKGLGPQLKWPGEGSARADEVDRARTSDLLATECGMMIPEYVTAGLSNYLWGLSTPSHLMSISTDSGQEDHVSMAANVAMRAADAADRVFDAIAIEFAYASQAAAIRTARSELRSRDLSGAPPAPARRVDGQPVMTVATQETSWWRRFPAERMTFSPPGERALAAIRTAFPIVTKDRYMADDLQKLAAAVRDGRIVAAAG